MNENITMPACSNTALLKKKHKFFILKYFPFYGMYVASRTHINHLLDKTTICSLIIYINVSLYMHILNI